ncbi:PIN domain-containing protein [Plasmodiophora brassicae]
MKLTRQKRFRRFLRFYQMNYGLEPPYVLIVDSDFIMAALRGKIHLKEQIPKLMQDRCFPRVSTCTMNMLKSRGEDCSGAFIVAKRFDRVQCGHAKNSTDEAACIADVLRKTTLGSSACAGVQNTDLRIRLRCQSYSIPILYISGQVPILEAPASIAVGKVKTKQAEDLQPLEWEKKSLGVETTNDASEPPRKKRKRAEPNPLSCKKKKPKVVPQRRPTADQTEHKPRRRRRKKHAASETQGTDEPTTATPDIIT